MTVIMISFLLTRHYDSVVIWELRTLYLPLFGSCLQTRQCTFFLPHMAMNNQGKQDFHYFVSLFMHCFPMEQCTHFICLKLIYSCNTYAFINVSIKCLIYLDEFILSFLNVYSMIVYQRIPLCYYWTLECTDMTKYPSKH